MGVTRETLRLQKQLRRDLLNITNLQVRDLVSAWATAWDEVSVDLADALEDLTTTAAGKKRITRAMVLRTERLTRSLLVINNRLEALAKDAGVRISVDLAQVIASADAHQLALARTQLPPGETAIIDSWATVDGRQLQAIVKRSTQQIHAVTQPLSRDAMRTLRRELIRGVADGSNPRTVARRILTRCEGRFNGGLVRATRLARTEILDAYREASRVSRAANTDVLTGWRWHCELSKRSCPACISMDGQLFPADDPGPNDHVNGRCTGLPETKSWRDLGIAMDEPPSVYVPAGDRFHDLDSGTQLAILGPARFEAWQLGRYPVESWATPRVNPGWRDSVQVSRAPRVRRGSSAALAS